MKTLSPLVGAHFRPPAKALLQHLPTGAPLRLAREPFNEFDHEAVAVFCRTATIPEGQHSTLEITAQEFGFLLSDILARSEWQLGYIAAKLPKGIADGALAGEIARRLDATPQPNYKASLVFDGSGRPFVEIEWSRSDG